MWHLRTCCGGVQKGELRGATFHSQVVDEEMTKEKQAKADEDAKAQGKEKADPVEPATKSESKQVWDWRVQNDNKPLWTRSPKEVCASGSCMLLPLF